MVADPALDDPDGTALESGEGGGLWGGAPLLSQGMNIGIGEFVQGAGVVPVRGRSRPRVVPNAGGRRRCTVAAGVRTNDRGPSKGGKPPVGVLAPHVFNGYTGIRGMVGVGAKETGQCTGLLGTGCSRNRDAPRNSSAVSSPACRGAVVSIVPLFRGWGQSRGVVASGAAIVPVGTRRCSKFVRLCWGCSEVMIPNHRVR